MIYIFQAITDLPSTHQDHGRKMTVDVGAPLKTNKQTNRQTTCLTSLLAFQASSDPLRVLVLRVDGHPDHLHHLHREEHLPGGDTEGRGRHGPRLKVGAQLVTQTVS